MVGGVLVVWMVWVLLVDGVYGEKMKLVSRVSRCGVVKVPSKVEMFCGKPPSGKPTITLSPTDDFEGAILRAAPNSKIFLKGGIYVLSKRENPLEIPSGVTLWSSLEKGKRAVWDGRNLLRPAIVAGNSVGVRIYGLTFQDFRLRYASSAILKLDTQTFFGPFNASYDPLYGYNPPNNWRIECCSFTNWRPLNKGSGARPAAIEVGSGGLVRGNLFTNALGRGVSGVGFDIDISHNRFAGLSWPWSEKTGLGTLAALKLHTSKNITVFNNYFERIGGYAVWVDGNSERAQISFNEGKEISFGFIRVEASGGGFVIEHNKVTNFGIDDPRAYDYASVGYTIHNAGGVDFPAPSNLIRGNIAILTARSVSTYKRQGFGDRDSSARRASAREVAADYGRLPDRNGNYIKGQRWRYSENNQFYGNLAIRSSNNGIDMRKSQPFARTYLTSKWDCNRLTGGFYFNTVLGKESQNYSLQVVKKFGINTSPGVIIYPKNIPHGAFTVSHTFKGAGLVVSQRSRKPAGLSVVKFEVLTKECMEPFQMFRSRGFVGMSSPLVLRRQACRCSSVLIRARSIFNSMCVGSYWLQLTSF